jgi:hypothetical protein
VLLAVGFAGHGRPLAQETPATPAARGETPAKAERSATHLEHLRRLAASYRITLDSEPPRPLTLKPEPVLRWSNPLRKTDDGALFVWLADGRPEAVGSFYRYRREDVTQEDHEFQSLATTGLAAVRGGREVWSPREPGVSFSPIPGAPAPAGSAAERLRQMRTLARGFKARFDLPADQSELRLLSQPIYRYEAHRPDLADGALFAFVQTTDPEVLLLIEARGRGRDVAWCFAFARMSMVNLRAVHDDRVVWSADWADQPEDPTKPYVTLPGSRQYAADPPGASGR